VVSKTTSLGEKLSESTLLNLSTSSADNEPFVSILKQRSSVGVSLLNRCNIVDPFCFDFILFQNFFHPESSARPFLQPRKAINTVLNFLSPTQSSPLCKRNFSFMFIFFFFSIVKLPTIKATTPYLTLFSGKSQTKNGLTER
jgi:hypothetical protein